jgi:transketolase
MVAARLLREERGLTVRVINLPWLNRVDSDWLRDAIGSCRSVHCLDNHYVIGGQGDLITRTVATWGISIPVHVLGLGDVPPSGSNPEVLTALGLDGPGIARAMVASLA